MTQRSKLATVVYLLLVFLSGALVGVFAYRLYTVKTVASSDRPRNPDEYRRRYVEEMRGRLKLSGEQVSGLQRIMDETRQRYHDLRESTRPQMKAIENDQYQRILGMLSDPQRAEYEKMRAERERRRQADEKKQDKH